MSTLTDEDLIALLAQDAESYGVPPHGPAQVLAALSGDRPRTRLLQRRWLQVAAAACVVLAVGVAVSSGGSGSLRRTSTSAGGGRSTSDSASTKGAPLSPAAAPLPQAGAARLDSSYAPQAAARPAAPVTDDGATRVVKTGTIALVAPDGAVSKVLGAVEQAAAREGGYISSSSTDEYGDSPSGSVTVRVPVARFSALVAQVRGLADVSSASTSGKDVTAQYVDLEAQLETLRGSRARFLEILSRTKTISEILAVQQRVDDVTSQINRIEGSRRLLASQSDLSTLTVQVAEKDDLEASARPHRSGLSQALVDAKDGFVSGVESVVRNSGRVLVWLLFGALVALVLRTSWRVARRRLV